MLKRRARMSAAAPTKLTFHSKQIAESDDALRYLFAKLYRDVRAIAND
jgi:hypothetical protein